MSIAAVLPQLKSIVLENTPQCKAQVHQLVDELMPVAWLCHPLKKGTIISRCRKDPKSLVRDEFTYKPARLNNDYQRASIYLETAFYGAVGDMAEEHGDFIAMLETSNLHRSQMPKGIEETYVSRWDVKSDLKMALICHPNVFVDARLGGTVNLMQKHYSNKLSSFPYPSIVNDYDNLVEYIAGQFAKIVPEGANYDYMVSAYFARNILNTEQGIIYPSVQVNGQLGFNIVLRTDVADSCLEFKGAEKHILYKAKDYMQVKSGVYSDQQIATYLGITDVNQLPIFYKTPKIE